MPTNSPLSWKAASAVQRIDSHTYQIDLQDDWCIGLVPHGGYVTSCIQRVAAAHFASTLKTQNQPHTMVLHLEFLKRTEIGPATCTVKDVKRGRQLSTIHITLSQHGHEEVIGYLTNTNLEAEEGATFETGWKLHPAPLTADVNEMDVGDDSNWLEQKDMPFSNFRKASARVRFFFPRNGQPLRGVTDQWLCFRDGSHFFTESLGYVADMFPQIVESFLDEDDPYALESVEQVKKKRPAGAKFWYPTVVLNLDVKKALPSGGVKWLFCRTSSKQIKEGRLDIEVVILDDTGELVALSHHVTLILSATRNLAARSRVNRGSKI